MYQNRLRINFIGNYSTGMVGEVADETHLARELENMGHTVTKVPRDQWKAYCDGKEPNHDWVLPQKADVNIICKWHHFNHPKYCLKLKKYGGPVLYWVWDYMDYQSGFHRAMITGCDLYLGNDWVNRPDLSTVNCNKLYYFPFDVSDADLSTNTQDHDKEYHVSFFGSFMQKGDRLEFLEHLKEYTQPYIFGHNHQEWKKRGFNNTHPPVYGQDFVREVGKSKIILGFNVNDHTWGYWSNRVGKVLTTGGFLLQRWVPGMELFLRDGAAYFSTPEEMVEKIDYYLKNEMERRSIANRGYEIGRERFTSHQRIKDLEILLYRTISGGISG